MNRDTLFCARCQAILTPGNGDFWEVRIEAVADPWPPEFTQDDLRRDVRREWSDTLEQLQGLSPREAMEQVYRRTVLYLCNVCFQGWYERPAD